MRTLSHLGASASMLVLRGLRLRGTRRLLARRRRCSRALLVPLIELLRLLLLLLRRPWLHRRCRPHQRMRLLWLRRTEFPAVRRRAVWRWLLVARSRFCAIFLLRSSLLLVHSRLRLQRRLHQSVVVLIAAVRLAKGPKTLLALLRPRVLLWPLILIHRSRPRRTNRPHQRLLIQMSACFRLPLVNRTWGCRWRSHRNHRTAYHRRRRPIRHGSSTAHDTRVNWLCGYSAADRSGCNVPWLDPHQVLRCRPRIHECVTRDHRHSVGDVLVYVRNVVDGRTLVDDHSVVDVRDPCDIHVCIGDVDIVHVRATHVIARDKDFSRA